MEQDFLKVAFAKIATNEGLRLDTYICPAGKATIGYGCNLERGGFSDESATILGLAVARAMAEGKTVGPDWKGLSITTKEADELLVVDMLDHWDELLEARPWVADLCEPARLVLLDMAFNLGVSGLLRFRKFWTALAYGEWKTAAREALDSKWAKQVGKRATGHADTLRGLGRFDQSVFQTVTRGRLLMGVGASQSDEALFSSALRNKVGERKG